MPHRSHFLVVLQVRMRDNGLHNSPKKFQSNMRRNMEGKVRRQVKVAACLVTWPGSLHHPLDPPSRSKRFGSLQRLSPKRCFLSSSVNKKMAMVRACCELFVVKTRTGNHQTPLHREPMTRLFQNTTLRRREATAKRTTTNRSEEVQVTR